MCLSNIKKKSVFDIKLSLLLIMLSIAQCAFVCRERLQELSSQNNEAPCQTKRYLNSVWLKQQHKNTSHCSNCTDSFSRQWNQQRSKILLHQKVNQNDIIKRNSKTYLSLWIDLANLRRRSVREIKKERLKKQN